MNSRKWNLDSTFQVIVWDRQPVQQNICVTCRTWTVGHEGITLKRSWGLYYKLPMWLVLFWVSSSVVSGDTHLFKLAFLLFLLHHSLDSLNQNKHRSSSPSAYEQIDMMVYCNFYQNHIKLRSSTLLHGSNAVTTSCHPVAISYWKQLHVKCNYCVLLVTNVG